MELHEVSQKALITGRITGKLFVVKLKLENALKSYSWDDGDTIGYIKDALKEIEEIKKLANKL